MKVVINACHGGFSLSHEALIRGIEKGANFIETVEAKDWYITDKDPMAAYLKTVADCIEVRDGFLAPVVGSLLYKQGKIYHVIDYYDIMFRSHPILLEIIHELGIVDAAGDYAQLKIVEVPDGVDLQIDEYDGKEWVAEKHRTWG